MKNPMISAESLFNQRWKELDRFLKRDRDFDFLNAAAILRQLLLDNHPLLHRANQNHRIKIRFLLKKVAKFEDFPPTPDFIFHGQNLIPSDNQAADKSLVLSLDEFLSFPIIETPHKKVTVSDIIKFLANKSGGVHYDASRNFEDGEIEEIFQMIEIMGRNIADHALRVITKITLNSLMPLRSAIVKIPTTIPLILHYPINEGSIEFAGKGQFFEINSSYESEQGWGFHGIIQIFEQHNSGNRIIFEAGNLSMDFPKISIGVDDESCITAIFEANENQSIQVRTQNLKKIGYLEKPIYLTVQLGMSDKGSIVLEILVNNILLAKKEQEVGIHRALITRQTIGANLHGLMSAYFRLSELAIVDKFLGYNEIFQLGKYFEMRYH